MSIFNIILFISVCWRSKASQWPKYLTTFDSRDVTFNPTMTNYKEFGLLNYFKIQYKTNNRNVLQWKHKAHKCNISAFWWRTVPILPSLWRSTSSVGIVYDSNWVSLLPMQGQTNSTVIRSTWFIAQFASLGLAASTDLNKIVLLRLV